MAARKHIPPRLATRLLTWLIRDDLAEEVLGDLEEKFYVVAEEKSMFRARLNYWYQVINYLRPFAVQRSKYSKSNSMLRHNLKLSFRSFRKQKTQFLINLIGLSTGIACVLFIYLWVKEELSIDKFHQNDNRIYQVMTNHEDGGEITTQIITPGLLAEAIESKVPEAESVAAWTVFNSGDLSVKDNYQNAKGLFAEPEFLEIFSYPLIHGDQNTALSDKSGIVISESLAQRLFESDDPVGRSLKWHGKGLSKILTVTGIIADVPGSSSVEFDYLMSWDYFHDDLTDSKSWSNYYALTTVLLNKESTISQSAILEVGNKINKVFKENNDDQVQVMLAKYSDLYLYDHFEGGKQAGGTIEYVYLLLIIGAFILFIASVNFINLSTARATCRMLEIGVKKTLGASRKSLIWQYLTESTLLSFLSFLAALMLVWVFQPYFNHIIDKTISDIWDWNLILVAICIVLLVGFVAGSYPAFYLSGFKILNIFRGNRSSGGHAAWGRKTLVFIQFTLAIILIAGVSVVYKQMNYINTKNLGYKRDNLIYLELDGNIKEKHESFLTEIRNIPGVSHASVTSFAAGSYNWTAAINWEGKPPDLRVQFHQVWVGTDALEMLDFRLKKGRFFSRDFEDRNSIIINETAAKVMGLEDPVGKTIRHWTGEKRIVGVVKDFNYKSLHAPVGPAVILNQPEYTRNIMAKIEKGKEIETLQKVEKIYNEFNPGYAFETKFVDQDYQALYDSERRISILIGFFAAFAIFISCLGLFGLATFTTERRTKEIGIRKVLGARVFGIVLLLSKDLTKVITLAAIVALPFSYVMASRWLDNFAYSISLHWSIFLIAGLLALFIAWITMGLQTFRSANKNPVNSLRVE